MRREKTSVSQEDYLKAIWEMLEEEEIPISARVAEQLGVTPPAVTAALKRMTRDDYLRIDRNGRIRLTAKGRGIAQHLALRHQLAEKLLTEIIGLDWAKAHDEAERLEHAISPEVEALLARAFRRGRNLPARRSAFWRTGKTPPPRWRRAAQRNHCRLNRRNSLRL